MTTKDDLETTTGDATKSHDEVVTTKESWVQCDSCNNWRRIPAVLADKLDDNVPWHCQDNPNAAFASCSIRQELTNEEIDKEQEEEEVRLLMHPLPCFCMGMQRDLPCLAIEI